MLGVGQYADESLEGKQRRSGISKLKASRCVLATKKCIFEKGRETNRGAAIGGVSEEGVLDPDLIRWRAGEDGYGGRRSSY